MRKVHGVMNSLFARSKFSNIGEKLLNNVRRFTTKLNENVQSTPTNEEPKPKRKRNLKTESKISQEFLEYFGEKDKELIFKSYPEKILRRKFKSPDHLYLADRESAKKISKIIAYDNISNKTIVEINPGIGLLTNELIERTESKLILYELYDKFLPHLNVSRKIKSFFFKF